MPRFWCGILCFLLTSCLHQEQQNSEIRPGDPLPAFAVTMDDGTLLHSSRLLGAPSLILFFHTGCSDCRRTIPLVQQAYERFGDKVRFVAVSRAQSAGEIRSWWEEHAISLPFSAQTDQSVYQLFATSRIPRIYISDAGGIVVRCYDDNPCPGLENLIQDLEELQP